MSFTCDYCCQSRKISASQSETDYRYGVLTLLCAIAAAEGGGGGGGGGNVNLTGINGTAPSVGAGAVDAGTLRTTLAGSPTVGLVAGSAIVGRFGIDQTTPGTTNKVSIGSDGTVGLVAGSAIIGNVRIDQTTPGTTNGVQLNASSAIVGRVGIDQTTPGTTNKVSIGSDGTVGLVAGSAIIGNIRIDQTTPGTTNGVQVNAALPAGSNIIGNVRIDQTTPGTTNAVVNTVVATATGWTSTRVAALAATVTQIKGSAGKLGAVQFYNPNTSVVFIQMFKVATAVGVTLGSTVADKVMGVPPLQSYAMSWGDAGTEFPNGIQVAATTTASGNTAPATAVEADFDWK